MEQILPRQISQAPHALTKWQHSRFHPIFHNIRVLLTRTAKKPPRHSATAQSGLSQKS